MPPSTIKVEIKRQSSPDASAVTEKFEIPYRPNMNITSLLGEIALNPVDVTGKPTTPITYDSNCLEPINRQTGDTSCRATVSLSLSRPYKNVRPRSAPSLTGS